MSKSQRGRVLVSTVKYDGTKVVLPKSGPDSFWQTVHETYAGDDQRKWKYLAMLALRENSGWPAGQDRAGVWTSQRACLTVSDEDQG